MRLLLDMLVDDRGCHQVAVQISEMNFLYLVAVTEA